MTEDIDIVIGEKGVLPDLSEALKAARFEEVPRGVTTPPSIIYRAPGGDYVQFLCRRTGAQGGRSGSRAHVEKAYGLVAESLTHVEILAFESWEFDLPGEDDVLKARVVHPACFILQKGLISESRSLGERAKDLLYVHDTLRLFDPAELRGTAQQALEHLSKGERRKFAHWRKATLQSDAGIAHSAAGIANASARSGRLTGDVVRETCSLGLELLFD